MEFDRFSEEKKRRNSMSSLLHWRVCSGRVGGVNESEKILCFDFEKKKNQQKSTLLGITYALTCIVQFTYDQGSSMCGVVCMCGVVHVCV